MSNLDQKRDIPENMGSAENMYSQRWNLEIASEILNQWRRSGMSMKSFSQENGIGYHRLISWRKKLKQKGSRDFVQISVGGSSGLSIEIVLTNGRIIRCVPGIDPVYIKTIIDLIER